MDLPPPPPPPSRSPPASPSLPEQRLALGQAAQRLAAATDFDETLRQTIAACLPGLGDFGFFDTVVQDTVRRTVAAHEDPAMEALLAPTQWVRQERTDMNLCALSTGEPALHANTDDGWYQRIAVNEGHLALLRQLGFRSMITVPMRYRDELVGALTLFMGRSGRRHTLEHLRFAADLAMLAAPVVVNARLLEGYRRSEAAERQAREQAEAARGRLEVLAEAGALLAHSLDPEDALAAIASTIVPRVADWCRIDLLDEHGVLQRRLAHHGDPQRAQDALAMAKGLHASPDTVGSMAWVIAHGQPHHGRFDEPPASEDPALRTYTQAWGMREHFIIPLVARGRTIGAMGVVQAESGRSLSPDDRALIDAVGQRAALALENARLYAAADAARAEAERASQAKDEFLAMLGHELRNPLAPIATALELMARRDSHAHVEERKIIARQVAHMSRLIDDLLDVSRITQGKIELKKAPVDLRTIVRNAVEQTQPVYERRPLGLELRVADEAAVVLADATRLTQVVCNLLVNAAKFTPADRAIRLVLSREGGVAELAVEDEGRGMPAELLPRVFDMFVQGRQAIDRNSGGLGLGLAIVRMLVELHGGTVSAHSTGEGQGSRFVVCLPMVDVEEDASQPLQPAAARGGRVGRILIVDDNVDAAQTLAELLRVEGHEVDVAAHPDAALQQLESKPAALALLDIGLPGRDGYELAREIRTRPGGAQMALVALTGYGRDNDRARALEARFDEHLVKPVDIDRLLKVVARFLQ